MNIYPDIFIAIRQVREPNGKLYYHTLLDTAVRKQHTDGKWYLNRFIKRRATEDVLGAEMCIKEFQIELYHYQLFGKVSPDSRDLFGNPMQPLDEDQRSEEERLKEEGLIIARNEWERAYLDSMSINLGSTKHE